MDIKAALSAYHREVGPHEAGWQERGLLAAAPYLQNDPPQYAEDVIEAMLDAWFKPDVWRCRTDRMKAMWIETMSVVLGVVLDRVCAGVGPNDEAWRQACTFFPEKQWFALTHAGLSHFLKLRRASLLRPVRPTLPNSLPLNVVLAIVSADRCPMCLGELDTGWECNSCEYDAKPWADSNRTAGGSHE